MKVPNWQHHSKKEQKRHLKPQMLRQAKAKRRALIRKIRKTSYKGGFFINNYSDKENYALDATQYKLEKKESKEKEAVVV